MVVTGFFCTVGGGGGGEGAFKSSHDNTGGGNSPLQFLKNVKDLSQIPSQNLISCLCLASYMLVVDSIGLSHVWKGYRSTSYWCEIIS